MKSGWLNLMIALAVTVLLIPHVRTFHELNVALGGCLVGAHLLWAIHLHLAGGRG